MRKKKTQWRKPELVILIKGRPEEGVLQGCKTSEGGSDAHILVDTCQDSLDGCLALCDAWQFT